jgi:hypothetical protein
MIVVIAGQRRKAGKTSVAAGIIAALPDLEWTAIKISRHPHNEGWGMSEHYEASDTDTGRYLAAGAKRAFWIRASGADLRETATDIRRIAAESVHTIVESNSILRHLTPDLTILVLDPSTKAWKVSGREAVRCADAAILTGFGTAPELPGIPCFPVKPPQYVTPAIAAFVRERLKDDSPA